MTPRLCPECGEPLRSVKEPARPFEVNAYVSVTISISLPTCTNEHVFWGPTQRASARRQVERKAPAASAKRAKGLLRSLASLPQQDVAKLLYVSPEYLSKVLNGHVVASAQLLRAIDAVSTSSRLAAWKREAGIKVEPLSCVPDGAQRYNQDDFDDPTPSGEPGLAWKAL